MNFRLILLSICTAFALTASAERLGVIEAERVYQAYGRQVKSGDFAEYNGMICYYQAEGATEMTLLIEALGVPEEAISLSINPDGWQSKETDEGVAAYVYNAPDGSFDVVVMGLDGDDALLSLSRKRKPTMGYLFDRKPVQ
ncbi:MAG: hypothetical protein K2K79_02595 [Paramuribaculum sp.]|nr:hypothetical protein [Paramuribaculum sp.]